MERIYLIICETEFINETNNELMQSVNTVYHATRTFDKAEKDKAWYEDNERKTNNDQFIRRKFFIQESILE